VRQDFFLGRSFRDLDDLNAQFEDWRVTIANLRVHATTQRVVDDHFADEQAASAALAAASQDAVLTVERRISQEGMVAVGGNQYSVPDTTRRRLVEVQNHPAEVRIFEDRSTDRQPSGSGGQEPARVDPSHRKPVPVAPGGRHPSRRPVDAPVARRPLAFYEAVGRRLANAPEDRRMIPVTERIRQSLVSLHMARALETLDQTLSRLERGEISAIEAIDALLAEELNLREGRRIGVALRTARLMPIKTLESFDFSFQPSLDRHRIMALAQLEFIKRAEVLHFLGPPAPGKAISPRPSAWPR
jgi:hypothetical protein